MKFTKAVSSAHSFTYNGKSYNSVAEMPPEVLKFFEDKNNNDMPDFIENMPGMKQALDMAKRYKEDDEDNENGNFTEKQPVVNDATKLQNQKQNNFDQTFIPKTDGNSTNNSWYYLVPVILLIVLIAYLLVGK